METRQFSHGSRITGVNEIIHSHKVNGMMQTLAAVMGVYLAGKL
jgi:hypothetical protein